MKASALLPALATATLVATGCINIQGPETVDVDFSGLGDSLAGGARAAADRGDDTGSDGGGWRDLALRAAGGFIGDGVGGCIFYAYDDLVPPGRDVQLVARVKKYGGSRRLAGLTVEYRRLADGRRIGSATTDTDGVARIAWTPPGLGNYRFTVKVVAAADPAQRELLDLPTAVQTVTVSPPDRPFVVCDLDGTLVRGSFARVLLWDGGRIMPDAPRVMSRIARRYGVIYLTHRPEDLTRRSRQWLEAQGLPDGPLLTSTLDEALGDAAEFKAARLAEIRRGHPNLVLGIGDKDTDVKAYRDNGIKAIWIPRYKHKAKDVRQLAWRLRRYLGEDIVVVADWREVEAAVFDGYTCSPQHFADRLTRLADRLSDDDDD